MYSLVLHWKLHGKGGELFLQWLGKVRGSDCSCCVKAEFVDVCMNMKDVSLCCIAANGTLTTHSHGHQNNSTFLRA